MRLDTQGVAELRYKWRGEPILICAGPANGLDKLVELALQDYR